MNILDDQNVSGIATELGLQSGRKVDPESYGRKGEPIYSSGATEKPRKKIPAVMGKAGVFYVSDSFRRLVEEFEPGRHQFFPYELRNGPKGPKSDEPYFVLNIVNRANSIVLSEERKKKVYVPPNKYLPEGGINRFHIQHDMDDIYSLRKREIDGLHLWWEACISQGFFVSEAFLERFDALKLKKLERVHCLEV